LNFYGTRRRTLRENREDYRDCESEKEELQQKYDELKAENYRLYRKLTKGK